MACFFRNFPVHSGSYKFIASPTCKPPRNHSNLLWSHWPFLWFLVQLWLGFLCPRTAKLLGSTKEKRTEAIRIEYQDEQTQLYIVSPPRLTDIHFTLIFEFFKCLALCVFWPTLKLYYSPCHALVIGFIGWLIKLRLCYLAYAFFCKACCIYYKCLEAIDTYSLNIFHRKTTQSASTN